MFEVWLSPASAAHNGAMSFSITLTDNTVEIVGDADGYALEGPLTTFFRSPEGRTPRLDPWSQRLLSIKTDRIALIRHCDPSNEFVLRSVS